MSVYNAFGDGDSIYMHYFTTTVLSNAVEFNLNTYELMTDMVMVIRTLS